MWWKELPKYVLVIGVIIVISLLFPNNTRFKHEFKTNQIWNKDNIQAPYDFPLLKSEEDIDLEKQSIQENFSPYYTIQNDKSKTALITFDTIFQAKLKSAKGSGLYLDVSQNAETYRKKGSQLLEQIYESGVVEWDSVHAHFPAEKLIQIVDGNSQKSTTFQAVMTPKKAQERLSDVLFSTSLKEAEFLIPVFAESIIPNIRYDKTLSDKFLEAKLNDISENRGLVREGSSIIRRGETITQEKYQVLSSYKKEFERRSGAGNNIWVFLGYIILTTLIISMLLLFLMFHSIEVYRSFPKMLAIFIWPVLFSFLVYLIESTGELSTYLIPFCIVPIVINHFFNPRLALFVHIVIILIASFLSSLGYEFTFLQTLAGIVAIFTNLKDGKLTGFFRSMIFIFLTYSIGFIGLSLIEKGGIDNINWSTCGWAFLNAFLTMLAYPLVPLLERIFGFTTRITLAELMDMNHPLLKKLSLEAPGTFQHSLQVANLAETAASTLGLNSRLVKVAALYHDVGKMKQPNFYIENQKGENPHDKTTDVESAQVIISHVAEGVKMAKKAGLPKVIIDFIKTHHGTTRTEYFYRNYKNNHLEEEVDEALFTYPGPKPFTKEQTIVMMADSIEASSKTLKNPTREEIENLVEKIVQGKINCGQFENSPLTFEEFEQCKKIFKNTLASIYHIRVDYPDLNE